MRLTRPGDWRPVAGGDVSAHCKWCALPWRAILLDCLRRGARPAIIARHYGLHPMTVVGMFGQARKQGCLGPLPCKWCLTPVPSSRALICGKHECRVKDGRQRERMRSSRFGAHVAAGRPKAHREPPDFNWPELPPIPRARRPRRPKPVVWPEIVRPDLLIAAGQLRGKALHVALCHAGLATPLPSKTWAPPLCPTLGTLHDFRHRHTAYR